jgi:glutamine amidotransferase
MIDLNVAIIKYNAGNIQSVLFAMERLGVAARVTDDPELINKSDKVIFPGVGEASSAMQYLQQKKLDGLIKGLRQPVLGICLGMQLMCSYSAENDTSCLGIFPVKVGKFEPGLLKLKIPQIGWNKLHKTSGPIFSGIQPAAYCYFVHSYCAGLCSQTIAVTTYGISFSSALQRDNFYGVQFHPEKSALAGEKILTNFLSIQS